jgi:hypothetical protein
MSFSIFGTNTASTFDATPITDDEKVDVRRFCGYSLYGNSPSGFVGYRFFQAQGFLEYRMTNCSSSEAQRIRKFLAVIYQLEDAVAGASDNLDTLEAGILKLDPNEVAKRTNLLRKYCRDLCAFLGVPPGEGLGDGGTRIVI